MTSPRPLPEHPSVLIVGAGMAGLTAASDLTRAGREVLLLDKGRGVGGRLANRRIGAATVDHGAQFITVREVRFQHVIDEWREQGVAAVWFRGSSQHEDGHPRYRGTPTMSAIATHLARPLDVRLQRRVAALQRDGAQWVATLESGESIRAGAVLLTPPVPQSLTLLDAGKVALSQATRERLERIDYDPCLAVMAVLDGPSRVPLPGGFKPPVEAIDWMADNQQKGSSAVPALTLHASGDFSREHWTHDRQEAGERLLRMAAPWLGASVTVFQVHGWRYSKPTHIDEQRCILLNERPPLVIAGDAFGGPRVEGAALSGWAAAEMLAAQEED